jgi:hypothetical protein
MACSNPWNSVFQVGSHHLAREFLKLGYEVAFISDPISPFHLLNSTGLKARFELCSVNIIRGKPILVPVESHSKALSGDRQNELPMVILYFLFK